MPSAFDIRAGQNRYEPCPRCRANFNMGLVQKLAKVAVQCGFCSFRGPETPFNPASPCSADEPAFDGWNNLPRCPLPSSLPPTSP